MSYDALNIEGPAVDPAPVLLSKHAKFFVRFLHLLPARLASHDSTRYNYKFDETITFLIVYIFIFSEVL